MSASSCSKALLALLIFTFVTISAFAQNSPSQPDFVVPARPTVSNPAEFQRPGVLQIEFGYNANFHAKDSFDRQTDFPMALRFAVSRRTMIELDTDSPYSVRDAGGAVARGAGDTQLGIQEVLEHETNTRPGVAIAYYVKLPTAKAGLGTGRADHNLIGLISKTIDRTTIDFNAVYLLAGRTSSRGHASSAIGAFCVSQALPHKVGIQGEISGATRNDEQPGSVYGMGVFTYQLNRRVVFDTGIRSGLTHGTPRVGLVAGITLGVAKLYKRH